MATISNNHIAESIYALTKDKSGAELHSVLADVVKFLDRKRLFSKSSAILGTLQKIINKHEGIVEVKIKSKTKLSTHHLQELKHELLKRYHAKEIIVHEEIDEQALGGFKVEVDNEVIDLTLRNKVTQLQEHLTRII